MLQESCRGLIAVWHWPTWPIYFMTTRLHWRNHTIVTSAMVESCLTILKFHENILLFHPVPCCYPLGYCPAIEAERNYPPCRRRHYQMQGNNVIKIQITPIFTGRVLMSIAEFWTRELIGAEQATRFYMKRWWSSLATPYDVLSPRWSWWRHQKETVSALLAFCVGISPGTGEFPAQRPVTRSLDVFFDLRHEKTVE